MPVRFTSGSVVKSLTTPDRHIGGRKFEPRQSCHKNQAVSRYRLTVFLFVTILEQHFFEFTLGVANIIPQVNRWWLKFIVAEPVPWTQV
jgi:hypothetical protein